MPYNRKYVMGDIVESKKFGKGIILGTKHNADKHTMAFYHVYYYGIDAFLYTIHATTTKSENATPESIEDARTILLTKMLESPADNRPRKYRIGDIIKSETGCLLVLDNGRLYENRILYHVCQPENEILSYSGLDDTHDIIIHANANTIRRARQLIQDYYFMPAFS